MNIWNHIKRWLWRIAAAILLVAAVVAVVHIYAASLDEAARKGGQPLPERIALSQRTLDVEPWNPRFRTTHAVLQAQVLLGEGKVDQAYFLLLPMARTVRGDALFRQTYQRALAEKVPLDARKAHQQHAREKKGGKLDEKDVLK